MDKKRIIFGIIFLVISGLLAFLLYRIFFAEPKPIIIPEEIERELAPGEFPPVTQVDRERAIARRAEELPPAKAVAPRGIAPAPKEAIPRVKTLTNELISNPGIQTGNMQFYNESDGKFYAVDANGNVQKLSDEVFFNVETVAWSPTKNEAILEYPDGANIYYNFDTKKQVTLPTHWEEFSFARQGDKVAAKSIGLSEENRWLIATNPEGNQVRLLEPLGNNADKVDVNWSPNRQVVALSRTGNPLGAYRQEIILIGQNKENFKSTVVEGRGLVSQWSPTGRNLLYSVYNNRNGFKPELWVVNANPGSIGQNRRLLNITTWADKCAFSDERYIYCGVPVQLQKGAGFAPEIADNIPDNLVKIDTQTGIQVPLTLEQKDHVVDSMFINKDEGKLFFTDKNKSGLFEVAI